MVKKGERLRADTISPETCGDPAWAGGCDGVEAPNGLAGDPDVKRYTVNKRSHYWRTRRARAASLNRSGDSSPPQRRSLRTHRNHQS